MRLFYFLRAAVIAAPLFFAGTTYAQAVGSDVFLQGNHVEVGIGNLGYYGSDVDAPAGYHPHGFTQLGFVADPSLTNWDTSTVSPASHYWGDYFLPGSPYEGWALEVNGMQCQAYNAGTGTAFTYSGGMPACTGSNIGYTSAGGVITATWQGSVDSITLTQVTTIDTGNLYFTTQVTLTNTASGPANNIYYTRNLDPDNDETWTGNFTTINVIQHQALDTVVVSATGLSSSLSYMALGTTFDSATAFITRDWPLNYYGDDLGAIYNQTITTDYIYGQGGTDTADYAIGLVMYIPHLSGVDSAADSVYRTTATASLHPANSITFTYFYSFSTAATNAAIVKTLSTTGSDSSLSIKNVNTAAAIGVYPNPSKDIINVTGLNINDNITLYDMMGRQENQNWTATSQGTNTFRYGSLPAGGYILVVTDATGNIKARIPVMKH